MKSEKTAVQTKSAFDRVIGYSAIRSELEQICDMVHNPEVYKRLGADLPKGILLHGEPGLGKSLMAKCFIEESGLEVFTVCGGKDSGDLCDEITETFEKARKAAPSIVLLDDMDKFANEDCGHRDAKEYVAIQCGIDSVKNGEVLVIATANDVEKLPDSLVRAGRFDRVIEFECPNEAEAKTIISHYFSEKKVSPNVDIEDVSRMISYSSCAELESIINDAAVRAGYARRESIEMADLLETVLCKTYEVPADCNSDTRDNIEMIAAHEAGHVAVSELLSPGSVGLVSIRSRNGGGTGGFTHPCGKPASWKQKVMISLAGKAATEMLCDAVLDTGSSEDIYMAQRLISKANTRDAACGFSLLGDPQSRNSGVLLRDLEVSEHIQLEMYMQMTRELLMKNRDFLQRVKAALLEKETLLYSDIQKIRKAAVSQEN